MIRIAICDDEPEQIEVLKEHIVRILFHLDLEADIFECSSSAALLDGCKAGKGFELIFLDISLADNNGIETAKLIRAQDRKALVIFVTGKASYMQKGYEARAFRYLIKPVTEELIEEVVRQALNEMQIIEHGCFSFKEKGEDIRADLDEILYFEAQNHRIILFCSNATYNFYGRIGDIERELKGKGFVRCQKGYIVNATRIRRIGKTELLLDNGRMLPLSTNYLRQTKDTFISILR